MIQPIKLNRIIFERKSPLKDALKDGVLPLTKDFLGGELTAQTATIDHVLAKCKGGKSKMSNYVLMNNKNNNLKGCSDIFEFATKENTEAYFKAFEGVQLKRHTGEQYLSMLARTLRELWEKSPVTKGKEMWEVLKRW